MQRVATDFKTTAIQTKSSHYADMQGILLIMPDMFKEQVKLKTKQQTTRATLVGTPIQSCTHGNKRGSVFEMEETSKQN